MSTMMNLTTHYVGIAERIGLDDVHVDRNEGFVLVHAAGHPMAIDLYPADPATCGSWPEPPWSPPPTRGRWPTR